jgi:hypothetical protein
MIELLLQSISRPGADLRFSCALAGVTGVLSHLLFFIRGYHVLKTTRIACVHLLLYALLLTRAVSEDGLVHGLKESAAIFSCYLATLFLSIVIYRLAFHPLRRFPGPFPAKVTKLYGPWLARNRRLGEEFRFIHEKHGHFVRVGKLSLDDPSPCCPLRHPC